MNTARIKRLFIDCYFSTGFDLWLLVRIISTLTPLLITYVFARGIKAFELGKSFEQIILIFTILLAIHLLDNFLRLISKVNLIALNEVFLVDIQEKISGELGNRTNKLELIQSIRNFTRALRDFIVFIIDSGLAGVVSFITIPVILFFIDKRIFVIELLLIVTYMVVTLLFSLRYKKKYERFDKSRELYYTSLLSEDDPTDEGILVKEKFRAVQGVKFVSWLTLQDLFALFYFLMLYVIVKDLVTGEKFISDLVLIVGYVKETQVFLNSTTTIIEKFREVQAGVERVIKVSNRGQPISSITS